MPMIKSLLLETQKLDKAIERISAKFVTDTPFDFKISLLVQ